MKDLRLVTDRQLINSLIALLGGKDLVTRISRGHGGELETVAEELDRRFCDGRWFADTANQEDFFETAKRICYPWRS